MKKWLFPVFLLFVFQICALEDNTVRFQRLSVEQGLSQSIVYCVLQGKEGYMWFGTDDGLNRYDGYSFKVFHHDAKNSRSLGYPRVYTLFEDSSGVLWVGTWGGGLNRFDRQTETFMRYKSRSEDETTISNNGVNVIYESHGGDFWIGTRIGLNRMQREKGTFTRYLPDPADRSALGINDISSIHEDMNGTLWIGTWNGLAAFDPASGRFTFYRVPESTHGAFNYNRIQDIHEDITGVFWLATFAGVIQFDALEKRFIMDLPQHSQSGGALINKRCNTIEEDRWGNLWIGMIDGLTSVSSDRRECRVFKSDYFNPDTLSNNAVIDIYEDRSGVMWIGTFSGISRFNNNKKKFRYYMPGGSPYCPTFAIHEDSDRQLWVGTYGLGLYRYDSLLQSTVNFRHEASNPRSLGSNVVLDVAEDNSGTIWVGTDNGLCKYHSGQQGFTTYSPRDENGKTIFRDVGNVYEDSRSRFWVSTDNGVSRFDRETGEFTFYNIEPRESVDPAEESRASCVVEDRDGVIWCALYGGGIGRYNPEGDDFTYYVNNPGDPRSLSHNYVYCLHEDRFGRFWIGTNTGGLNLMDRETGTFTVFKKQHGLPNDVIFGILEDEQGYLWLSTNKGISRFDPVNRAFKNYDTRDGLQSYEFNPFAYYKSSRGEMFFGGPNGFNSFFPGEVKDNLQVPPTVLTGVRVFNKWLESVRDHRTGGLIPVDRAGLLEFSYTDNFITLEFAALDFLIPGKNRYKYKLEGVTNDWIDLGHHREVTFSDLEPGRYVVKMKASNNDGVWNETGKTVEMLINPPFWKTLWFRFSGILILMSIIAFLFKRRMTIYASRLKGQARLDFFISSLELSNREQEIVQLVLQGKSNKQIETELYISVKTVKNHIYKIYRKVGVKSRMELMHKFNRVQEEAVVR